LKYTALLFEQSYSNNHLIVLWYLQVIARASVCDL
jgi:hypothetical protein